MNTLLLLLLSFSPPPPAEAPAPVVTRDFAAIRLRHVPSFDGSPIRIRFTVSSLPLSYNGGVGGVKTHSAFRGQGFASTAIRQALDFFHEQGEVDLGLLVCESGLVPFYERLGWSKFPGDLFVTQRQATVPFTFNLPMTFPIRLQEPLAGRIDLLGPPW